MGKDADMSRNVPVSGVSVKNSIYNIMRVMKYRGVQNRFVQNVLRNAIQIYRQKAVSPDGFTAF